MVHATFAMTADQPLAAHKQQVRLQIKRRVPIAGALLSLTAFIIGMLTYRGSSFFDTTHHGFHIGKNMVSDLGVTSAYRGEPLLVSNILFIIALVGLAIGITTYSHHVIKSHFLRLVGSLIGISLVCVGFVPSDRFGALHDYLFFGATGLSAIWMLGYSRECNENGTRLVGTILAVYALFLATSPRPTASVEWRAIHSDLEITMLGIILVWLIVKTYIHARNDT